jgi:hypothetical protein
MNGTTIHVAVAIARRGGTHYRARAYAELNGIKHSFTVAIDDSAVEAERDAIQYVKDMFRRDGLEPPHKIQNHGRKPAAIVDMYLF